MTVEIAAEVIGAWVELRLAAPFVKCSNLWCVFEELLLLHALHVAQPPITSIANRSKTYRVPTRRMFKVGSPNGCGIVQGCNLHGLEGPRGLP